MPTMGICRNRGQRARSYKPFIEHGPKKGMAFIGNKLVDCGSKIVAVGRNYAGHAKELGSALPKEPLIFLKPTSSYVRQPDAIEIPKPLESLHHEVELGVVIGRRARDVLEDEAMNYVKGYALALDMTARDLQSDAKAKGLPWTVSKGYDTFTPISDFVCLRIDFFLLQLPKKRLNPEACQLWLKVDDELKQKGSTTDMIFKIPFLIKYISSIMTLNEGDVILTGTPEGVGPVRAGQTITCGIKSIIEMKFPVITRPEPNYRNSPYKGSDGKSLDGNEAPE